MTRIIWDGIREKVPVKTCVFQEQRHGQRKEMECGVTRCSSKFFNVLGMRKILWSGMDSSAARPWVWEPLNISIIDLSTSRRENASTTRPIHAPLFR